MSGIRVATLGALLALAGACDGDMDQKKDADAAEAGLDLAQGAEAGADLALADLVAPDLAAPDFQSADIGLDQAPLKDAGANVITGTITASGISCTASTSTDCKGPLAVVAFASTKPSPSSAGVATVLINNVDLSGSKSVGYVLDVSAIKTPAVVHLAGILADGGTMSVPPWPSGADMANSKLVTVTLSGSGPYKADIVLDTRAGTP